MHAAKCFISHATKFFFAVTVNQQNRLIVVQQLNGRTDTCNATTTNTVQLDVLPTTQWLQQPQSMVLDSGDTITLTLQALGAGLNYRWWKGTDTLSTNDSLTLENTTEADSGWYYFQVAGDCGILTDSLRLSWLVPTGIAAPPTPQRIKVWPNPTTGHATIELPPTTISVEVRDDMGRLLAHYFQLGNPLQRIYLPDAGLYHIRLLTHAGVSSTKLVVVAHL